MENLTHEERSIAVAACRCMIEWQEQEDPIYFFRTLAEREALKRAIVKLCKEQSRRISVTVNTRASQALDRSSILLCATNVVFPYVLDARRNLLNSVVALEA